MTGQLALDDRHVVTVACPRCKDTHTIGIPHTGPKTAWCPRSGRTYEPTIDQETAA